MILNEFVCFNALKGECEKDESRGAKEMRIIGGTMYCKKCAEKVLAEKKKEEAELRK